MRKIHFKSLYTRLVITFISIWWFVSFISFGLIVRLFAGPEFSHTAELSSELVSQFQDIRQLTFITLLLSIVLGTIAILYFSQGIVKPIILLSHASLDIAKGNYEVSVKVEGKDELAQLSNRFNQMALALSKLDQSRKDFVSSVSHEFKTPVTSIKGFAQMIKNNQDLTQIQTYADIILEETQSLSQLSSELLTLSQIDSDVLIKEEKEIAVDEILRRVVLSLEPLWQKKEIDIELDCIACSLKVSELSLQLIFSNLITNAIKYSNTNTTIQITLSNKDDGLHFIIKDQGIGISFEQQTHIFDRFYKVNVARNEEGHGLGLAIVKASCDHIGAQISVTSAIKEGTQFEIIFKK